ncbi:MAG: ABC transporter substrate-binding protein [Elsteraceae bacterium]
MAGGAFLRGFLLALSLSTGIGPGSILAAAERSYGEAPMLADLVSEGRLPPVGDRLPEEPLVVIPQDRVGVYGGSWRIGLLGDGDGPGLLRMVGYDGMMSWKADWSEPFPNIARAVEVSPDAREYLFHLRKGMKWSDGSPFTAEDVVFGLTEITFNKEIHPLTPAWYRPGGVAPSVEAVDPLTVRILFKESMSLFLEYLATADGQEVGLYQKQYCSQFLPNHNPQADAEAKAQGFASWVERLALKCARRERPARWGNPERPTLNAWMVEKPYAAGVGEMVMVRNPYYWKVDTRGNQLPYLDRVVATVGANVEKLTLMAMNGQLDMQDRHVGARQNRKILENAQRRGNFRFYELTSSSSNTTVIAFNGNHMNPTLRRLFEDRNFRIGVSHAINRQAIIDVVYQGRSKPAQVGPIEGSPLHNPALTNQYLAHDLSLARAAFDRAPGLRAIGDGRYSLADGSPISISIDMAVGVFPEWAHSLDMIKVDLARLGVDLRPNVLDRRSFQSRYERNDFDAQIWGGDGGWDAILQPRWYFPSEDESRWAPLWALWHINPKDPRAELPPPRVREQMALYQTLLRSTNASMRNALMRRILDITREEFPVIGICLPENGYGIVRNDFHNVPTKMPFAWSYPNPGPVRPEQFFSTRTP